MFSSNLSFFRVYSESVALTFGAESIGYSDLDNLTNKIANHLQRNNIYVGDVVVIRIENPKHVICVMLACIKIGATYIYIPPSLPYNLQIKIISDSSAKIVFDEMPQTDSGSTELNYIDISDNELVYIIYTSGTTGNPKGVGITRKALSNYIDYCINNYFSSPLKTVLMHGSMSCDMPVTTIFPALYTGKTIFLAGQDFTEHAINKHIGKFALAKVTPSHIRLMMKFNKVDLSNFTDVLIVGGETLTEPILKFCKDKMPNTLVVNEYGPTETTVGVTSGICNEDLPHIGAPVSNTKVHILDKNLNFVKKGDVGRLYITGTQLSRGYVGDPKLTAEKFIANVSSENGDRMYDSGDLVRELENGNLLYLGRSDSQMKINGYRIEPYDIESKLLEINFLLDVFVTYDTSSDGNNFLIAYYTLDPKASYNFVTKWQDIYEDLYENQFSFAVNNIGWKNSYDNTLLSLKELIEWRDDVISKILKYKHVNVFEIGCGTGMITTVLQKICDKYVGVDFSENVIAHLSQFFQNIGATNVELHALDAQKSVSLLSIYEADLVILNSVVQYFPTVNYLEELLINICMAAPKEKSIYIGDIRDFRLANSFYESIELFNNSSSRDTINDQILFRGQNENELLISPSFFLLLAKKLLCISYVEFLPKQGNSLNELNLFRYDAVIHINANIIETFIPEYSCSDLNEFLTKTLEDKFIVRNYFVKQLHDYIKSDKANSHKKKLIYIDDLKFLANKYGYNVYISVSASSLHSLNLLFSKQQINKNDIATLCKSELYNFNDPVSNNPEKNIPPHYFKNFLRDKLPDYMIPAFFIKIENIGVKSTGKIDTSMLPKVSQFIKKQYYHKPQNEIERKIAVIWQRLLSIQNIGRNDDFWKLGGNSLIAMQLISDINYEFEIECKLKDVFSNIILKDFAQLVSERIKEHKKSKIIIPLKKKKRSECELGSAQQSLWFIQETAEQKNVYHAYFAANISGEFNSDSFKQCLLEIIERHQQLRVCIRSIQGKPFQTVQNAFVDYIEEFISKDDVMSFVNDEISKPFDIFKGKLFRIKRLKISEVESVIVFSFHHIITDGWSIGILIDELNILYNAKILGAIPNLPKLEYSYFDYIDWQNDVRKTKIFEQKLKYWQQKLNNITLAPLKLSSKSRSQRVNHCGDVYSSELPDDIYQKLKDFAHYANASISMVLLSLFQFVLSKLTGETDIIVGVPTANRRLKEFDGIIGLFVNTIPIRTIFNRNYTFNDFIKSRVADLVNDYENQDVSFDQIVNVVGGNRSIAYNPIFQIMFVFQNTREAKLDLLGTTSKRIHLSSHTTKCDIVVTVTEEKTIVFDYEHAINLFDIQYIQNLNKVFQRALEFAINNPDLCLSDFSYTSQQIVETKRSITQNIRDAIWSNNDFDDKIAIVYDKKYFSYGFVNSVAELIKSYLYQNDVGICDVVAISISNPVEFIFAICGVIKAGAMYLPIDPSIPVNRKNWMISDSKAKIVIDNLDFLNKQKLTLKTLKLNQLCPAYVIYTSGSTGLPKGVIITHESLLTTLFHIQDKHLITADDIVIALSNFGFDLSVFDILGTFLVKGSIVIPKNKKDPFELEMLLKKYRVSVWNSVPALMEMLLSVELKIPNSLRFVILSGDKITTNLRDNLIRLAGNSDLKIISAGGATECAIWSISCDISISDSSISTIPYGYAMRDQSIYVLDNFLQLTADNANGEIFIGGNGIGTGYINHPELTAEKFIANPFGNGDRFYKTGDFGMSTSGCAYIIGRIDDQIKLHGFRIELKEIEKNILDCDQVKAVNVMLNTERKIIAIIVPYNSDANEKEAEVAIRKKLTSFLPDYMIPHEFIFINEMPLTSNGKVDTNFLLSLLDKKLVKKEYVAPKTDIEKTIEQIWKEVLSTEKISVNDNFFQLGGDSVMAIQIVSKLRARGLKVRIEDIFLHQTIKNLSVPGVILNEDSPRKEYYFDQSLSKIINSILEDENA